ncbi:hypothetical protein [Roseisolibacter sp. H3M3-2]|uniref:hypothetical protein n=1 Tax=Roseisolibacter sp. H3M3-2 TaxID=3031323 RepID=UPI0023D9BE58|nr:hypothetical protein [Roseisolibacter sp. H3M3-2]MDF1502768.1 hypothetical protein [Roseisolibacter sp. H3M3-2]
MTTARFRTAAVRTLAASAIALLAACADGASAPRLPQAAPDAAPRRDLLGATLGTVTAPTAVQGLLWLKEAKQETATKVIGPAGGSLGVGGMKLTVPKGAVTTNLTFSVTRVGGRIVAYEFQPHGTTFRVPVKLEFETKGIDFASMAGASRIAGAHFLDASALDQTLGLALVTEFAPTIVAVDKSKVTMEVPHFSGWMVSTGRR